MTMRDAKGRFIKSTVPRASVPAVRHSSSVPPTFRSSLPLYAALVGFAAAWYYAAPFIILAGVVVAPFLLLWWLEPRYPTAAYFLYAFLSGVIDGVFGRRGRWRRL